MNAFLFVGLFFPMCIDFIGTFASETNVLKRQEFTGWPRSRVDDFGCFLEKTFGYVDKKFNCRLKNYINKGDPCKNTTAYYEGPTFPENKAKEVHPLAKSIELSWEHGELQNLIITLNKKMTDAEVRKTFTLSEAASIQQCGLKNTCILLVGFDHMGAGDVDCSSPE
jgi:hypothetical protein